MRRKKSFTIYYDKETGKIIKTMHQIKERLFWPLPWKTVKEFESEYDLKDYIKEHHLKIDKIDFYGTEKAI